MVSEFLGPALPHLLSVHGHGVDDSEDTPQCGPSWRSFTQPFLPTRIAVRTPERGENFSQRVSTALGPRGASGRRLPPCTRIWTTNRSLSRASRAWALGDWSNPPYPGVSPWGAKTNSSRFSQRNRLRSSIAISPHLPQRAPRRPTRSANMTRKTDAPSPPSTPSTLRPSMPHIFPSAGRSDPPPFIFTIPGTRLRRGASMIASAADGLSFSPCGIAQEEACVHGGRHSSFAAVPSREGFPHPLRIPQGDGGAVPGRWG
jgi:hypothetical protein